MTLVFAAVMALVLGATGVFVYLRFSSELDATINAGLRSRANDVVALVKEGDAGLREGNQTLVGVTDPGRLARAIGWKPSCAASGVAPACARAPFRFVGYNGYPDHGDPASTRRCAHPDNRDLDVADGD